MSVTDTMLTAAEGAALLGAPEQIRTTPPPRPSTPFRTADEREQDVAARFRKDTARHEMTVLHDDGLYRHLRFTSNPHGYGEYWFDLITWPGRLAMCGDIGENYVFSRTADMFKFFRADRRSGINPHYWAEKLGGGRRSVQQYSEDLLRQLVVERFVEDARYNGGVPAGTGKALRTWVLNEDLSDEHQARNVVEDFAYKGYEFADDVWEWDFHDYDSSFLWACHAISWGITRYDKVTRYGLQALAAPCRLMTVLAGDQMCIEGECDHDLGSNGVCPELREEQACETHSRTEMIGCSEEVTHIEPWPCQHRKAVAA